jgi:hypothetical protein
MISMRELSYTNKLEMVVLGSAISGAEGLKTLCTHLKKEDFYSKQHQFLFLVLEEAYLRALSLDAERFCEELRRQKILTELGGKPYINKIVRFFQAYGCVDECIEGIKKFSALRQKQRSGFSFKSNWVTCKSFLRVRNWATESSLRCHIFFNKHGFADRCVKRVGRNILIDLVAFDLWLQERIK